MNTYREIERNCGDHSGALGLPAVLVHFDNVLLLVCLFIAFFSVALFVTKSLTLGLTIF